MKAWVRQEQIIKYLNEKKSVQVEELAEEFNVSKVTVRADLDFLAKKGILVRTHGGAITPEEKKFIRKIANTINESTSEKISVCKKAASLIKDGDTIILDNGSTTVHLAKYLSQKNLTVATTSLIILNELIEKENVEVVIIGGLLRRNSLGAIGPIAKTCLNEVHSQWYFMGASGVSLEKGITCSNLIEAETKQAMIDNSEKVCLVVDSLKIGKVAFAKVCNWSAIDYLIVDKIEDKIRKKIEKLGVEVIISL